MSDRYRRFKIRYGRQLTPTAAQEVDVRPCAEAISETALYEIPVLLGPLQHNHL